MRWEVFPDPFVSPVNPLHLCNIDPMMDWVYVCYYNFLVCGINSTKTMCSQVWIYLCNRCCESMTVDILTQFPCSFSFTEFTCLSFWPKACFYNSGYVMHLIWIQLIQLLGQKNSLIFVLNGPFSFYVGSWREQCLPSVLPCNYDCLFPSKPAMGLHTNEMEQSAVLIALKTIWKIPSIRT